MFKCVFVFSVMIATKQQRFPIIGQQNQQKSTTSTTTTTRNNTTATATSTTNQLTKVVSSIAATNQQPQDNHSICQDKSISNKIQSQSTPKQQQNAANEKVTTAAATATTTSTTVALATTIANCSQPTERAGEEREKRIVADGSHEETTSERKVAPQTEAEAAQSSKTNAISTASSSTATKSRMPTSNTTSAINATMNLATKKGLTNASSKIQQRQQKFLAAAAKSATGTVASHHQAITTANIIATSDQLTTLPRSLGLTNNNNNNGNDQRPQMSIGSQNCPMSAGCTSSTTDTDECITAATNNTILSTRAAAISSDQESRMLAPLSSVRPKQHHHHHHQEQRHHSLVSIQSATAPLISNVDKSDCSDHLPEASHPDAETRGSLAKRMQHDCETKLDSEDAQRVAKITASTTINFESDMNKVEVSQTKSVSPPPSTSTISSCFINNTSVESGQSKVNSSLSPPNCLLQSQLHRQTNNHNITTGTKNNTCNSNNNQRQQSNIHHRYNHHNTTKSHHFINPGPYNNSQQHNSITTTTTSSTQHLNQNYHSNHPVSNLCANYITKTPTTNASSSIKHQDPTDQQKQDSSLLTTPIVNKQGNNSNFSPKAATSNANCIDNNQQQRQLHNFNINSNHQNLNNHHNHHHQYNHHNDYSHHQGHMLPLQQQQQQQQNNTMAHYKYHNDCQSSVLTYEQVKRLDSVMDQVVPIHGRGNFPTLFVKLKELIRLVRHKLQSEHSIEIRDVRLNGGAASYVLAPENSHYNDLDLVFGTDLSDESRFDVIRDVVLECLREFYPMQQEENQKLASDDKRSQIHHHLQDELIDYDSPSESSRKAYGGGLAKNKQDQGVEKSIDSFCDLNETNSTIGDNIFKSGDRNDTKSTNVVHTTATISTVEDAGEKNDPSMLEQGKIDKAADTGHDNSKNDCKNGQLDHEATNVYSEPMGRPQYQPPHQMPLNYCSIKEAYVHKMVKVNDDDRWSLISLGVQQSEANRCPQQSCASQMTLSMTTSGCCYKQQQAINSSNGQWQQFPVTSTKNEGEISNDKQQSTSTNQSSAPIASNENSSTEMHQHQQLNYLQHHHHEYHQQKQFPNSIELKFVDRMRRKFEFSVDSFQIILDSLIQFYDFAPQSTITSQWQFINSHPSTTMIITRPLINYNRRYSGCCGCIGYDNMPILGNHSRVNVGAARDTSRKLSMQEAASVGANRSDHHLKTGNDVGSRSSERSFADSTSPDYYQQPQLEPANSPPISSEASSSGCSSSSSVVSSSSSSLSCDEDNEDLYCDTYGASSSASTSSSSSLLSSTATSLVSSDGINSVNDLAVSLPKTGSKNLDCKSQMLQNLKGKSTGELEMSNKLFGKLENIVPAASNNAISTALVSSGNASSKTILLSGDCRDCIEQVRRNSHGVLDDFEINRASCAVISENFYPTVIGRSEYGDFKEALYHLESKLIATRSPEEIRGGGLLKYCNLLVKNYKPTNVYQIRTLERYMCSRFFIDFSDLNQQQAKLESYLANHFSDDPVLKYDYLTILHNIVSRSTVCLMNHELRLTLNMIKDLAYKFNEQQNIQLQQQLDQQHHQVQSSSRIQTQQQQPQYQQQHFYNPQKPILIHTGVYRVKLVNYTLAKPVGSS